jgi:uncharacterized protein (DUF433 family)
MSSGIKESKIVNHGRGPAVAGTRITVYDVMDYYKHGWRADQIVEALPRLSVADVQAAIDYIEAHKDEVTAEYQRIIDRHRNYKYPDWVQKIVDECRGKTELRIREVRERRDRESRDADDHG